MFKRLYDKVLSWSQHRLAVRYLAGLSFAESSFFPVPPDVMLMPMSLARPNKALYYAWVTTLFSLLGGLLGYSIGYFSYETLQPFLQAWGYQPTVEKIQHFFDQYGVWVVLLAGFSPIPYKLFTITAGAAQMALLPFIAASFIGRGLRFFLVAYLMKVSGERYADKIRKAVDWIGWSVIALVIVYLIFRLSSQGA